MTATTDTYKGHKVLKLARSEEDKYPFSFGLAKAELILEHIVDIKAFVNECRREKADAK